MEKSWQGDSCTVYENWKMYSTVTNVQEYTYASYVWLQTDMWVISQRDAFKIGPHHSGSNFRLCFGFATKISCSSTFFFNFSDGNWQQAETWVVLLAGAVEVNALAKEYYGNSLSDRGSNTQPSRRLHHWAIVTATFSLLVVKSLLSTIQITLYSSQTTSSSRGMFQANTLQEFLQRSVLCIKRLLIIFSRIRCVFENLMNRLNNIWYWSTLVATQIYCIALQNIFCRLHIIFTSRLWVYPLCNMERW